MFFHSMCPGESIASTTGAKQGDPIFAVFATVYFSLTIQGALQAGKTSCPNVCVIAYADYVNLVGPGNEVSTWFHVLEESCQQRGLQFNASRCKAYSSTPSISQRVAHSLNISHAPNRVTVCGTPIGSPTYVNSIISATSQRTVDLIDQLTALPVSAHTKWVLIQRSLQRRMTHYKLAVPWFLLQGPLHHFQSSLT
jgi:hypothetical protein